MMPRWTKGEADIEQLINRRELEKISGATARGQLLLVRRGSRSTYTTRSWPTPTAGRDAAKQPVPSSRVKQAR